MKLIFCTRCHDVIQLRTEVERTCVCGQSGGQYVDPLNAEIFGPCIPVGFHNPTFEQAIGNQPERGMGERFTAFVIPRTAPTIKRVERVS